MDNHDNSDKNKIFFLLEENNENGNNLNIEQMFNELNDDLDTVSYGNFNNDNNNDLNNNLLSYSDYGNMSYFVKKQAYGNDELFYHKEYTVKDLLKICNYYQIDKHIKTNKCKKSDLIESIIFFESLPENFEIVLNRNIMWAHITELLNDKKMKKYIIWS